MGVCVGRVHLQRTEEPSPRGFIVCVCQRATSLPVSLRGQRYWKAPINKYKGAKLHLACVRVFVCVDCTNVLRLMHFWLYMGLHSCGCRENDESTRCEMSKWAARLHVDPFYSSPTQHIIIAVQRAVVNNRVKKTLKEVNRLLENMLLLTVHLMIHS